jgi:hypothetical protein
MKNNTGNTTRPFLLGFNLIRISTRRPIQLLLLLSTKPDCTEIGRASREQLFDLIDAEMAAPTRLDSERRQLKTSSHVSTFCSVDTSSDRVGWCKCAVRTRMQPNRQPQFPDRLPAPDAEASFKDERLRSLGPLPWEKNSSLWICAKRKPCSISCPRQLDLTFGVASKNREMTGISRGPSTHRES